jgi:hypothetical protein
VRRANICVGCAGIRAIRPSRFEKQSRYIEKMRANTVNATLNDNVRYALPFPFQRRLSGGFALDVRERDGKPPSRPFD